MTTAAPNGEREAIAFDLDMTLIDSRPASRRALERLVAEHDLDLAVEDLMAAYGLPLSMWLPAHVDPDLFRAIQQEASACATGMRGASAALEAARAAGARIVVVTASRARIAESMLEAAGLRVDRIWADVWGAGKVEPLVRERCRALVGDHADDMAAARRAGAIGVGVRTGTSPPVGATVELADLTEFPRWLAERRPVRD